MTLSSRGAPEKRRFCKTRTPVRLVGRGTSATHLFQIHANQGYLVEHLTSMDDTSTALQIGSVDIPSSDWKTMQAGRTWDLKVSFVPPYSQPPTLVPIFKMLDVANSAAHRAFRAFTKIDRVDSRGGTIKVGTCGDTKMFGATVAWMAIPAPNFDLRTGIVSVPPGGVNTRVTFPRPLQLSAPGILHHQLIGHQRMLVSRSRCPHRDLRWIRYRGPFLGKRRASVCGRDMDRLPRQLARDRAIHRAPRERTQGL